MIEIFEEINAENVNATIYYGNDGEVINTSEYLIKEIGADYVLFQGPIKQGVNERGLRENQHEKILVPYTSITSITTWEKA